MPYSAVSWCLRPLRPFAMRFLRQTARGPLVEALPAGLPEPGALTRLQRWSLKKVGRTVGSSH